MGGIRLGRLGAGAGAWVVCFVGSLWLAGCSVYDPGRLPARTDAAADAQTEDAQSHDDGGDTDGGAIPCVPSDDPLCPEICPETCNGRDDDCDGNSDENPLTLCTLASAAGECIDGACSVVACLDDAADCDGLGDNGCEARLDSPDNCGSCRLACDFPNATARCEQSTCLFDACLPGFGNCDGDPSNGCELRLDSLDHCGGCLVTCALEVPQGQPGCIDGACGISECDEGYGDCDGDVDNGCETALDALDTCGSCTVSCSYAHAMPVCGAQGCVPGTCDDGYADCDGELSNDCETNLNSDPNHCGACERACADLGGGGGSYQCVDGACEVTTCPTGFADCDDNGDNGCETPLDTLTDCGGCDIPCARSNATVSCDGGTCAFVACNAGYGNCDNNPSNGCEVPLDTDSNCGACGTQCGVSDSRTCSGGVCSLVSCPGGSADCDGDGIDCEQMLNTLAHCGACNARCGDTQGRLSNATASCTGGGTCTIGTCDANFANCDSAPGNGCETSLRTTSSCGACGNVCSRPNASVSCATGSCAISACNSGFANCDGNATNGCETSTTTTTDCGGCNIDCARPNAVMACSNGTCTRTACTPGFGDCDGNANNGCEQALNTNSHCGACNTACALNNGSESCSTGTCTLGTCDSGFGNCDFMASNGCETALNTNSNCNACGSLCDFANAAESCATQACSLGTCNAGFGNCDGNTTNGCEQSLNTNAYCGACNNACGSGQRCDNGVCVQGFPYTTSNFTSTDPGIVPVGAVTLGCGTTVFNSTPGAANNGFSNWCSGQPVPNVFVRAQGSNLPDVVVLAMDSFTLNSGATLQLIGTRPVILAVFGNATISGTIDANANGTTPGAGGNQFCGSSAGGNGPIATSEGRGGGGGAFGGNGGRGGAYSSSSNDGGTGGVARGNSNLQPLLGGCNGGHGGGCTNGVAGGGSVQISVGATLAFNGTVRANGATGGVDCGGQTAGSGGGSGGGILIEASALIATGATVQARGGNGGNGNGGAGASGSTTLASPNGASAAHDNDGAGGGGGSYGRAAIRGVNSCTNNVANVTKLGTCT